MKFSRVLLAISLAAAVAMIAGDIAVRHGGSAIEAPPAFSH